MKILFDLTALYDHLTGIERFAMNISKNIISQHPETHMYWSLNMKYMNNIWRRKIKIMLNALFCLNATN